MSNLLTGSKSPIPGFSALSFDLSKALSILHDMEASGYDYGLGSKCELSSSPPVSVPAPGKDDPSVDCSGFHRYVVYHCSGGANGGIILPDGSIVQNDWYAAHGFKHHIVPGENSPCYLQKIDPAYVYAAFCKTGTRGERIGHVWLIAHINGAWWTLESHGGKGPNSRRWNTPILAKICTDLYPIAKVG